MKRIYIIKRSSVIIMLLVVCVAFLGWSYFYQHGGSISVFKEKEANKKEFTMITTEFKSETKDGKVLEVYRWDPGTIVVNEGDQVTLKFIGVQGNFHPYEIKGLGIKGEVKKGEESKVTFIAPKRGMYPIVCGAHTDLSTNGPMIGYLVVD